MEARQVVSSAAGAFRATPPIFRPLMVMAPLLVVLHFLWTIDADDEGMRWAAKNQQTGARPATAAASVPQRSYARYKSMNETDAMSLIQESPEFALTAKARCPRRLLDSAEEWQHYPVLQLLVEVGAISVTTTSSQANPEKLVDMTAQGRNEFLRDIEESPNDFYFALADRTVLSATETEVSAERDRNGSPIEATMQFTWHWKPRNRLGQKLSGFTGQYTSYAYLKQTNGIWSVDRTEISDPTPDYRTRQ